MANNKMYAIYSETMAKKYGVATWIDKNNKKVICTAVSTVNNFDLFNFADKILLGEVVKFIKSNIKNKELSNGQTF